jgi:hypothetical protein
MKLSSILPYHGEALDFEVLITEMERQERPAKIRI